MKESSKIYYENQNLQDIWLTSENFKEDKLEEIKKIDNVKNVERLLTINANVIDSERFINPDNNKPISDLVIECNFIETNEINKMYLIDGEEYSKDKTGLWLDYYLAKNIGIKVGDEFELSIEGNNFKEKVMGLVEVPDHVYFIKDESAIFPAHNDFGFSYLSINEFPKNYIFDKVLETDEVQDAINNLKDLKDTLSKYGITDYSKIPSKNKSAEVREKEKSKKYRELALQGNYNRIPRSARSEELLNIALAKAEETGNYDNIPNKYRPTQFKKVSASKTTKIEKYRELALQGN